MTRPSRVALKHENKFFGRCTKICVIHKGKRRVFVFSAVQTFYLIGRLACTDGHFLSINSNDTCEVCAPLPKQGLQVRRRGMGQ